MRFPGQYFDRETGTHYNYFRDYDPSAGIYSENDPIFLIGGLNLYAYGYQNPMRHRDPNGLFIHIAVGAVIGGMSGLVAALGDPCASPGSIAQAVAIGAAVGALGAVVPVGGSLMGAVVRGAATGFGGNTAGQLVTGGFGNYSVGQAVTQGVVGGVSAGAGNAVAVGAAVNAVRSGATASAAINTGNSIGTTYATATTASLNMVIPSNAGGMNSGNNNQRSPCGCNQ